MPKKYAVHPGHIVSRTDGDVHFITGTRLAILYELRPDEYIVWGEGSKYGRRFEDYIHLYPNVEGNYGRPSE